MTAPMTAPMISVVVLGYSQFDRTTGPCLESLKPWLKQPDFEFIVFDNASPDGSGDKTRAWCLQHPTVRFFQSSENLGYAGGMNAAAAHAQGRWLLLVNNDTEFPSHTLDALLGVLRQAPANLAMVGPVTNAAGNGQRLYDPDKSRVQWLELGAWLNAHPTGQLLPTYRCDFFCIAIRQDAWQALGGLDPVFGRGYYEDFDFSLRLRQAGYEQAITEDVFIYHQGSATFGNDPSLKALIKTNKRIMQKRHPGLRFLHVRECNLDALVAAQKQTPGPIQNLPQALQQRQQLRWQGIRLDQPRSPLKRSLWRFRLWRTLGHV